MRKRCPRPGEGCVPPLHDDPERITLPSMAHGTDAYVANKLHKDATARARLDRTHAAWIEQLRRFAPLAPNARVLDVACGSGLWAAALAREGLRVHGLDLQRDFLVAAREAAGETGHAFRGACADATCFPYRSGSFDVVTAFSVLEHVPDWKALLDESLRVLRPGGVLWITTTNRRCPVTDEIAGFPLYPWYPEAVKSRVLSWVMEHRPELVAYSPAPAIHWFTAGELIAHLAARGCERTATWVQYASPPRVAWKRGVLRLLRASPLAQDAFEYVHPACGLLVEAPRRGRAVRGESPAA